MPNHRDIKIRLLFCLGLIIILTSSTFTALAGRGESSHLLATKTEIQKDINRFKAAGAQYNASGFDDFPNADTPFQIWQRLPSNRLVGDEVAVSKRGHRIWKYLYCARDGKIYMELALMGREGDRYPFGWLACNLHCSQGGKCSTKATLFIDINGDGIPEIRFANIKNMITVKSSFFRNTRIIFNKDIVPRWLKRILGPDFRNISTIGPGASISTSKDHPCGVSEAGGGQAN